MAKVLFIIAQQNFRDEELLEPKQVLENANVECSIASITTNPSTGKLGTTITPDLTVKDAQVDDFDAVVVVGGPGAPELANHPEVLDLLKAFTAQSKIVSAICIAPIILAKAGLLQGKKATVYLTPESEETLKNNGAELVQEDVVIDGQIITANGPEAARRFGQAILDKLI